MGSTKEWLADYSGEKPTQKAELTFVCCRTHNTEKQGGRVLIDFVNEDGEPCTAFYNVDLNRQRGKLKGKKYPRGQFRPPEHGAFRKLWLSTGAPPRRWTEVHEAINQRFAKFVFTGDLHPAPGDNKIHYQKITDLAVLKPRKMAADYVPEISDNFPTTFRQLSDNSPTTLRQGLPTMKPSKAIQHKADSRSQVPLPKGTLKPNNPVHPYTLTPPMLDAVVDRMLSSFSLVARDGELAVSGRVTKSQRDYIRENNEQLLAAYLRRDDCKEVF